MADSQTYRPPEPGRFENGVFIPARLDGPDFTYDVDDPEDVTNCECGFRCIGLAAWIRHSQQEHLAEVNST